MTDSTGPERTENLALTVALALAFVISVVLIMLVLIGHVRAEDRARTFTNSKGQEIGRSVTHGNTTNFENSRGQTTDRAERRPDGTTIFFDAKGRSVCSARK
jgi:hypothetical protein